jgi:hypothetical protein
MYGFAEDRLACAAIAPRKYGIRVFLSLSPNPVPSADLPRISQPGNNRTPLRNTPFIREKPGKNDHKYLILNFFRADCTNSGHTPVERLHSIEKSPHTAARFSLTLKMKRVKT